MDVRPIAVSESLHNIFSACCLSRFNEKAKKILLPFQYGINTTDGVSSAIFATDVLFRQNESNVCMSLDFSNAFNSLSRRSIHGALLQYMPELIPYFQSTYCTYSNLHFGNNILISSSGVKARRSVRTSFVLFGHSSYSTANSRDVSFTKNDCIYG
ncbi:hypothetical protein P9112_013654 [Eukaryota sp. TZLM1-RC]